jgi:hypothetical protein
MVSYYIQYQNDAEMLKFGIFTILLIFKIKTYNYG